MVQEIKGWLTTQDYATGVALYQQHGTSEVRKRMFASGISSFNSEKLHQSLLELLGDDHEPAPAAAPAPRPRKKAQEYSAKPSENISINPELVEQIMEQLRPCFDERMLTHARLDSPRLNDQDRLRMALRIHELSTQIKKLLKTRAYVLEHGQLPPETNRQEVDESDKAALIQHRNNLRSTRSKLKKQPEKAADLQATETEIERLTTLIKTL